MPLQIRTQRSGNNDHGLARPLRLFLIFASMIALVAYGFTLSHSGIIVATVPAVKLNSSDHGKMLFRTEPFHLTAQPDPVSLRLVVEQYGYAPDDHFMAFQKDCHLIRLSDGQEIIRKPKIYGMNESSGGPSYYREISDWQKFSVSGADDYRLTCQISAHLIPTPSLSTPDYRVSLQVIAGQKAVDFRIVAGLIGLLLSGLALSLFSKYARHDKSENQQYWNFRK